MASPRGSSRINVVEACLRLRPDTANLADPVQTAKPSLRSIALRTKALGVEARALTRQLDALTAAAAPATKARFVVDVQATLHALLETISESADTEPNSTP